MISYLQISGPAGSGKSAALEKLAGQGKVLIGNAPAGAWLTDYVNCLLHSRYTDTICIDELQYEYLREYKLALDKCADLRVVYYVLDNYGR